MGTKSITEGERTSGREDLLRANNLMYRSEGDKGGLCITIGKNPVGVEHLTFL